MAQSFEYDQSTTLVRYISRYIRQSDAESLLDIGAGFTETAIPLSQLVHRYVGVEEDEFRATALRNAGLNIICGKFPLPVSGTFDIVLASHSVPESGLADYDTFCGSAANVLNPGLPDILYQFES